MIGGLQSCSLISHWIIPLIGWALVIAADVFSRVQKQGSGGEVREAYCLCHADGLGAGFEEGGKAERVGMDLIDLSLFQFSLFCNQ